jgi:hypothetical protein
MEIMSPVKRKTDLDTIEIDNLDTIEIEMTSPIQVLKETSNKAEEQVQAIWEAIKNRKIVF